MSRSAAARSITPKQLRESMEGVLCAHEGLLLDEAPAAHKDIRIVMRGKSDLVKILYELRPLVSLKGR